MGKPLYERHRSFGPWAKRSRKADQHEPCIANTRRWLKKSRRIIDVVIDLNHRCSNGQNLFLSRRDPDLAEESAVKGFQRAGCSPPSLLVVWMEVGRRGEDRRWGEKEGEGKVCTVHKWKGKTTRPTTIWPTMDLNHGDMYWEGTYLNENDSIIFI